MTGIFASILGWKLNPVVGAVYGPEFYAGKGWGSGTWQWPGGVAWRGGAGRCGCGLAGAGPVGVVGGGGCGFAQAGLSSPHSPCLCFPLTLFPLSHPFLQ